MQYTKPDPILLLALLSVDERFYEFVVRKIVVPGNWPITALIIDAPVDRLKRMLEKDRGISFESTANPKGYIRKVRNFEFRVFIFPKNKKQTVVQCDDPNFQ